MMASKKIRQGGKAILGKDELRRLMKEHKTSLKGKPKRIDSPLAKYNNAGQLMCVLCGTAVKSEILWNAHILGRTHKENLSNLKTKNEAFPKPAVSPVVTTKKSRNLKKTQSLPDNFFDSKSKQSQTLQKSSGLGLGDYSSSDDEGDSEKAAAPAPPPVLASSSTLSELPTDFFDAGIQPSGLAENEDVVLNKSMAEKLPEGFFDDPKMDAKVRKVEYRDKQEDEWELFQRTMKAETNISEAIMEEEDDVINAERNIEEIDDQLHRWSKVDNLLKQKEQLMSQDQSQKENSTVQEEETDEMQEFDEFLDWRTKKAWK